MREVAMRRLWMSLLAVPVILGLAIPTAAAATPVAPAEAHEFVRVGMHDESVRTLQKRLAALKYYPGPINGEFGTDTQEAVWAFQETQGLPGEDYVDSAMWRALAHPR